MAGPDTAVVTSATFDDFTKGVALVDFTATWCGPCKALAPIVDKLATEFKGKVNVGKLDIDENPEPAQNHGIMGVPTLLFFKGGKVVDQHVGLLNESALRSKLQKLSS
ncbi:MAG: thioredoxin [Planctomycetes bacterium]|nr:thioredoxin [Planctomycetota bacterium]